MSLPRGSTCSLDCRDCTFSGCRRLSEPMPDQSRRRRAMAPLLRMLPDTASSPSTSVHCRAARWLGSRPDWRLPVEPDVFQAKVVDDAVDHHCPVPDPRLPAIGEAVVKNDRPRPIFSQPFFDLPHQLLALPAIALHRLAVEQLFEFGTAIAGVVARRATAVALVKLLVGIIDAAAGEIGGDRVVLAVHFGIPEGGLDHFELTV